MNSILPSRRCYAFSIVMMLCFCFLPEISQAQIYFIVTGLEVLPANPNDQEPTLVRVQGVRSNSCSFLDGHTLQQNNPNFSVLNMDWDNEIDTNPNANCSTGGVAWEMTFSLGILQGGSHAFFFTGSNYAINGNSGISNPTVIQVADAACNPSQTDIVVSNTLDDGPGSLRQAIVCANANPGYNRVVFNFSGTEPDTFRVGETTGEALPTIFDDSTTIDATTHSGFGANGNFSPKIVLDGQFHDWETAINAVFIQADFCEVYGLEIINFPDDGIDILGGDFAKIGGINKGNVIHNNGSEQDFFPGNPGRGPWEGCGIVIRGGASRATIHGNYIGTNFSETTANGNEFCGVLIRDGGDLHQIGGQLPGMGNVIVNNANGVAIGSGSSGCSILQNNFYCNDSIAILLSNNVNNNIAPPVVNLAGAGVVSGTAGPNQFVEVFINDAGDCGGAPCQGRIFLGRTQVSNGEWSLNFPFANNVSLSANDVVTAIATDLTGNSSNYSNCFSVEIICQSTNGIIEVTNTNDDGPGSLRAAIDCANNLAAANTIRFDIPGSGPHIIAVGSTTGAALPSLLDARTTIDGTTQPGFGQSGDSRPVIILDGGNNNWNFPINALFVRGDFCEIYGLEIRNFPDDGIDVNAADFVKIGDNDKGNVIYNCGSDTDFFSGSPGTGPWEGCAIVVRQGSANCDIIGNTIGTDFDQQNTIGNEYCGILIRGGGDNHQIGNGTEDGANIIAHNATAIRIRSGTAFTRITRNAFYCNDTVAINLLGTANNQITPPEINVLSAAQISGTTSTQSNEVEIFVSQNTGCGSAPCQGRIYLGTAMVNNGNWLLNSPYHNNFQPQNGAMITAIAISANGNSSGFANCATFIGCDLTASVENITTATCDQDNGSATILVNNGTPPFNFNFNNQNTSNPNLTGLAPGTYNLLVTDDNDCETTTSFVIQAIAAPELTIASQTNASCNNDNGSFTLSVTGGTPDFEFTTNQGTTFNPNFTDLTAGTYSVTVTDGNSCTDAISVTIEDTNPPVLAISQLTSASCGAANGSLTVIAVQGTSPYTYSIDGQPQPDGTFSNLADGVYMVGVEDQNGCTAQLNAVIGNSPPVDLSLDSSTAPTCGTENGQITVSVSGGTAPYDYTLNGDAAVGPAFDDLAAGTYQVVVTDEVGCTSTVQVVLEDSGNLEVIIAQQMDDNCNEGVGSFTLSTMGGTAPYEFDMGDGRVNTNEFSDLIAGTYTVTVTDANDCDAVATVVIEHTGTEPTAGFDFMLDGNVLTVQSSATNADGIEWDFGDGTTSTQATFVHPYQTSDMYTVCLTATNVCGSVSSCETIEVIVPLSNFSIGGIARRMDGTPVGEVMVDCTGETSMTTTVDGTYLFADLPEGADYTITPFKDINHPNGVNISDIIRVRAHILLTDAFTMPGEYVAADADRNGVISINDIVEMRNVILLFNDRFANNTSWRFLPEDQTFGQPSDALLYDYPESIVVADLDMNYLSEDFIAIKIGDVNDSNDPTRTSDGISAWRMTDQSAVGGQIVEVTVRLNERQRILGFQAALGFDENQLELLEIVDGNGAMSGISHSLQNGRLNLLWYSETTTTPEPIAADSELFTLRFLAHQSIEKISEVIDLEQPTLQMVVADDREEQQIEWAFTDNLATNIIDFDQFTANLYPNPFHQETFISFELMEATSVFLTVFDALGRTIIFRQEELSAGLQRINIQGADLPASGTYFYQLNIGEHILTGKMLYN